MDLFNSILRALASVLVLPFGDAHPLVSLTPISILTGIGMLWVFRRTSDQKAIGETKKRLQAYLLELRLYDDDLSLVWQAQKNLLAANLRYVGLMLKPALFLILPLGVLLLHLDAFYGKTALQVGEPAVVTVQSKGAFNTEGEAPRLEAPAGVVVETPAVRAVELRQCSWRIRPVEQVSGSLRFTWGAEQWEKSVAAGERLTYLSSRRVSSWWDALWHPGEDRLSTERVAWAEVRYPSAEIELGGIKLHWLIWFFVLSMISAIALKGRFRVVF